MNPEELGNRIIKLTFNQTNVSFPQTFLFAGTTKGFRAARVEDGKVTTKRDKESELHFEGGFSCLAPMFSTSLLCVVGSPTNVSHPPNIVYFWDEFNQDMKGEIRFRSVVRNVFVRRDKVIIILEKIVIFNQTYVYALSTYKPVASIPTIDNPKGIGAISYDKDRFVLVTLDTQPGYIRVEDFYNGFVGNKQMHENPINYVVVDYEGNFGASASEQGTIIRVFDCASLTVQHELRRGTSPARITCLSFSPDVGYLLASSDHSTVHVWRLKRTTQGLKGFMSSYLPEYFQSDRSFSKLNLQPQISWICPYTVDEGPIAAFTSETEFVVAHLDGHLYRCVLDEGDASIVVADVWPFIDFEGDLVTENNREWASF